MKSYILLSSFLTLFITPSIFGQVRINEVSIDVDYEGQPEWVELYNAGSTEVDVSSWELCTFPAYLNLGTETPVLIGSTTIQPGEYLVVAYNPLVDSGGEVGLYINDSNFAEPSNMVDYMEYITSGQTRESVAVTAGYWTTSTAVPAVPAGKTYSYFEGGATPVENWDAGDPTPGAMNAVATSVTPRSGNAITLRHNYPNPFNTWTQIDFDLEQTATVKVSIYDVLGRLQLQTPDQTFGAGTNHAVRIDGTDLATGTYIYEVSVDTGTRGLSVHSGTLSVLR